MKTKLLGAGALASLVLAMGAMTHAHHSFCVEYDANKPFALTGKVTKISWANPHTYVQLEIKDSKGVAQQWVVQAGPPKMQERIGWTAGTLKAGDEIAIRGWQSRDGSRRGGLKEMVFNGKTFLLSDTPLPC